VWATSVSKPRASDEHPNRWRQLAIETGCEN
jgi:hypothetical protein